MIRSIAKHIVLAGTLAMATTAFADGMPRRGSVKDAPMAAPAFSWTGFYGGLTAGAAFADIDTRLSTANGLVPNYFDAEIPNVNALGSRTFDDTSFVFGAKVGYNQQIGSLVLGFEADLTDFQRGDAVTATGTPFIIPVPPFVASFTQRGFIDTLVTLRPRIGVGFGQTHIYATGGLAIGDVHFSSIHREFAPLGLGFGNSNSTIAETKVGWVVGAGLEFAATSNWIVGVEYLHVDLGSLTSQALVTSLNPAQAVHTYRTDFVTDIVRASISYKF